MVKEMIAVSEIEKIKMTEIMKERKRKGDKSMRTMKNLKRKVILK